MEHHYQTNYKVNMPLSKTTRWLLNQPKVNPIALAERFDEDVQHYWEYLEDVTIELRLAKKEREVYLPNLQKKVIAFRDEFPIEFRKEIRLSHLEHELKTAFEDFEKECMEIAKGKESIEQAEQTEKKIQKTQTHLKIIHGFEEGITQQEILNARNHPITNLIEAKRMMAVCPFHNEKTPSMYLKNNFYHCFGCGANGDTIDLVMKTKNMSFKEAVNHLQ